MTTGLQRTWVRITLTALTAAMMLLIFFFSTETAERSDKTSGTISKTVISVIHPDYEHYQASKRKEIYDTVQHAVRKAAHFTEYMILGLLLRLCLESWFGKRKWLAPGAWLIGTLYAGTDELHQILTDGRSGQWTDVLLDSSGVLTGVALALLILHVVRSSGKERKPENVCP